jgi:predicted O-linked N-acetylglucosamine transferase (SPINDLY family)
MSLFSKKLAPIQINFLGYAGTSGAAFFDYLIADEVVIPSEYKNSYSEQVLHLPDSFFPINNALKLKDLDLMPSRASQGLPNNGFIFGCFNNAYKITPAIFEIWMNLLREAPNSVLWLSQMPIKTIDNLKKEAQKQGIEPDRLIFASRVPGRKEHLSRLRLMDLFLDTPNYNAHATAADALLSGVPVLTLLGNTYAGRVAASQLTAAGLPELIVHSEEQYFAKAMGLVNNPQNLAALRQRLENNQETAPLFNTNQYVKNLEELFKKLQA